MKQVIRKKIKEVHQIDDTPPIFTLLVDGNSLLKQSLVSQKVGANGKDYGAVYQFYNSLGGVIEKYDFSSCWLFFDAELSGQLRYDIYNDYKANRDKHYEGSNIGDYDKAINDYCRKVLSYSKAKRVEKETVRGETEEELFERQKKIVLEIAEELFLRTYEAEKYVEGDDLIAFYVQNKKPNEKVVIVTRDRDLTQLIADDVSVYLADLKKFIHPRNHIQEIGYHHENVLIKKIMCGDSSDNIKGVKGLGEKTFFELFPEVINQKVTLEDILQKTQTLIEERKKNKKKPLLVTENILNGVTLGCQGDKLYEINEQIINLKKPLLTGEAMEDMINMIGAPLDPEGRDMKHVYQIIKDNGMIDLYDETRFSNIFSPFFKVIENEKKFSKIQK